MESSNNSFNASPQTPPRTPEVIEVIASPFAIKQEVLRIFNIEATEDDFERSGDTYILQNQEIKNRVHEEIIKGLREGNSANLEFAFHDGLLSKSEITYKNSTEIKELAIAILLQTKDQRRASEKRLFVDSGILTEEEAGDSLYMFKR